MKTTKTIGKAYYIEMSENTIAAKPSAIDAVKGMLALLFVGCAGVVAFGYFAKGLCLLGTRKEMPEFAFFMKAADIFTLVVAIVAAIYAVLGVVYLISKLIEKRQLKKASMLRKEYAKSAVRCAKLAKAVAYADEIVVELMNIVFKCLGKGIAWIYKM